MEEEAATAAAVGRQQGRRREDEERKWQSNKKRRKQRLRRRGRSSRHRSGGASKGEASFARDHHIILMVRRRQVTNCRWVSPWRRRPSLLYGRFDDAECRNRGRGWKATVVPPSFFLVISTQEKVKNNALYLDEAKPFVRTVVEVLSGNVRLVYI